MNRGVVALAVTAVGIGLVVWHPSFDDSFTMTGSIQIGSRGSMLGFTNVDGKCEGLRGYSDISPGTAVLVQNSEGKTVATGALQEGMTLTHPLDNDHPDIAWVPYACTLPFSVPDVPEGLDVYSVTVSHRGTQVVTKENARKSVDLIIGEN